MAIENLATFKDFQDTIKAWMKTTDTNVLSLIKQWINEKDKYISSQSWAWWMRENNISLITTTNYDTGTVDVVKGSKNITGNGTTWTADMVGRTFVIDGDSIEYEVATFSGVDAITITENYAGDTANAVDYDIEKRLYSLATGFKKMTWVKQYNQKPMDIITEKEFRKSYYDLSAQRGTPQKTIIRFKSKVPYVQFAPNPNEALQIVYDFQKRITKMSGDNDVPNTPADYYDVLLTGVRIDVAEFEGDSRLSYFEGKFNKRLYEIQSDKPAILSPQVLKSHRGSKNTNYSGVGKIYDISS